MYLCRGIGDVEVAVGELVVAAGLMSNHYRHVRDACRWHTGGSGSGYHNGRETNSSAADK